MKDRTGERRIMNCGEGCTIIDYRNCNNMRVRFDDGTEKEGVAYRYFKNGEVGKRYSTRSAIEHIGERRLMNCGEYCTIVEWYRYNNIKVRFDDGTERDGIRYQAFLNGRVAKVSDDRLSKPRKSYREDAYKYRVGEQIPLKNGGCCTITAAYKYGVVDVVLSDGMKLDSVSYYKLKNGRLSKVVNHGSSKCVSTATSSKGSTVKGIKAVREGRVGERGFMNCGEYCVITECYDYRDITVRFDDGTEMRGVSYSAFERGSICKPGYNASRERKHRIGEKRVMKCGENCTIIKSTSSKNITVRFDDGTVKSGVTYKQFYDGTITKRRHTQSIFVGDIIALEDGRSYKVIGYNNRNDITLAYSDGTVRLGVRSRSIYSGNVEGSNSRSRILYPAYSLNGVQYYKCEYGGKRYLGTIEEIREEICK